MKQSPLDSKKPAEVVKEFTVEIEKQVTETTDLRSGKDIDAAIDLQLEKLKGTVHEVQIKVIKKQMQAQRPRFKARRDELKKKKDELQKKADERQAKILATAWKSAMKGQKKGP